MEMGGPGSAFIEGCVFKHSLAWSDGRHPTEEQKNQMAEINKCTARFHYDHVNVIDYNIRMGKQWSKIKLE